MDLDNQKAISRFSTIIPGELFVALLTITIILIIMVLKFLGISLLWMWFADSLVMLVSYKTFMELHVELENLLCYLLFGTVVEMIQIY